MTDHDIETKVREILTKQLGVPPEEIRNDAQLVEELGIDSLDFAEMLIAAENEFNITIDEERFRQVRTVNDVLVLVGEGLALAAGPRPDGHLPARA